MDRVPGHPVTVYRIPDRVAHVVPDGEPDVPDTVFLMRLPDGSPQLLRDSAAWVWVLAADGERDVPAAVARLLDLTREEVAADCEVFLAALVSRGLLEEAPPA